MSRERGCLENFPCSPDPWLNSGRKTRVAYVASCNAQSSSAGLCDRKGRRLHQAGAIFLWIGTPCSGQRIITGCVRSPVALVCRDPRRVSAASLRSDGEAAEKMIRQVFVRTRRWQSFGIYMTKNADPIISVPLDESMGLSCARRHLESLQIFPDCIAATGGEPIPVKVVKNDNIGSLANRHVFIRCNRPAIRNNNGSSIALYLPSLRVAPCIFDSDSVSTYHCHQLRVFNFPDRLGELHGDMRCTQDVPTYCFDLTHAP